MRKSPVRRIVIIDLFEDDMFCGAYVSASCALG